MVGEVGIHDDHEVAGDELKTVDISGSETELTGARGEDDVLGSVGGLELAGDFLRAVGGCVVNDDELPVEAPGKRLVGVWKGGGRCGVCTARRRSSRGGR